MKEQLYAKKCTVSRKEVEPRRLLRNDFEGDFGSVEWSSTKHIRSLRSWKSSRRTISEEQIQRLKCFKNRAVYPSVVTWKQNRRTSFARKWKWVRFTAFSMEVVLCCLSTVVWRVFSKISCWRPGFLCYWNVHCQFLHCGLQVHGWCCKKDDKSCKDRWAFVRSVSRCFSALWMSRALHLLEKDSRLFQLRSLFILPADIYKSLTTYNPNCILRWRYRRAHKDFEVQLRWSERLLQLIHC